MMYFSHSMRVGFLCIIVVAAISLTFLYVEPISQDITYHAFADQRLLIGFPNGADVLGNVFFIIFGIYGIYIASQGSTCLTHSYERVLWKMLFCAALMIGFGSAYYHLSPTNITLAWDRLPMTIAFMIFFSLVLWERLSPNIGTLLSIPLICVGIWSVVYWYVTEQAGVGDLRLYALIQFLPLILIPVIFLMFPPRYTGTPYLIYAVVWYVAAKALEFADTEIFLLTNRCVSGHTLKHVAAAISVYSLALYLRERRISVKPV